MKLQIVENYKEMSKMAADIFAAVINEKRNCVPCLYPFLHPNVILICDKMAAVQIQ